MRLTGRLIDPAGGHTPLDVTAPGVRFGRDSGCEVRPDPARFPQVSGVHARIEPAGDNFVLVPLSRSNRTLLNGRPLTGPEAVAAGDRVRLGVTGPEVEITALALPLPPPEDSPGGDFGQTVQATDAHTRLLRGTAGAGRFPVGVGGVFGRPPSGVEYPLDHPHVSRRAGGG